MMAKTRTLVSDGCDRRPQSRCWPGQAKVAVVFQIVFEQWEGNYVTPGRHTAPPLPTSAIQNGTKDWVSLSWQEYAGRAGIYRLLDTAVAEGVAVTGLFNGLAVERFPDAAREFVSAGHEISAHGWSEDIPGYLLTEEQIRADMRRTCRVIEDTTGYVPRGWCSPGYQAGQAGLVAAARNGFDYLVESVDDDRPVFVDAGQRTLVGFAPSFDINDNQLYLRGLNAPSAYVETFVRHLGFLLDEPRDGLPPLITAVFHASLFGHPMGSWAFKECIRHAKSTPGVWLGTHGEAATQCMEFFLNDKAREAGV